jgi:hypothetical protein
MVAKKFVCIHYHHPRVARNLSYIKPFANVRTGSGRTKPTNSSPPVIASDSVAIPGYASLRCLCVPSVQFGIASSYLLAMTFCRLFYSNSLILAQYKSFFNKLLIVLLKY